MEWQTARVIYKMVIEPTMTYGIKAAALTKANRTKLGRYERLILRNMINCAGTKPNKRKIYDILEGKTITRRIKYLRFCYFGHVQRRKDTKSTGSRTQSRGTNIYMTWYTTNVKKMTG